MGLLISVASTEADTKEVNNVSSHPPAYSDLQQSSDLLAPADLQPSSSLLPSSNLLPSQPLTVDQITMDIEDVEEQRKRQQAVIDQQPRRSNFSPADDWDNDLWLLCCPSNDDCVCLCCECCEDQDCECGGCEDCGNCYGDCGDCGDCDCDCGDCDCDCAD